ncbi:MULTISPECIES: hypothetical protein [Bacillus cereus group]|uniref:hypothetical protein n=1 Tax=Bacillus cereus group TaxID=86661 RepID=UPI0011550B5E|nr:MULTISPECIES: hypothetical protein [Bacillus cereus group]MDM5373961.1 hypothetical protein [Bacillus bombysepticus]MCR6789172.1 hypothetical protein [Bacillus thuringiensis]MCR6821142.1 hypothetical protein [Bacillus thuringiensis]MCR6831248.1 hypothetical protein [Bacillus thuringiensis]MEB8930989.1 hypothetical protein [Bacillus cereus]
MNKKERMLSATSYAIHVIRSFYFIFKRSFLRKEKRNKENRWNNGNNLQCKRLNECKYYYFQ